RNADSEENCEQELKTHFQIEDETVKRVLDTQASFRQFTPERHEKLVKDIQEKQSDNQQQQLLIESEEARKERLIQELEETSSTSLKMKFHQIKHNLLSKPKSKFLLNLMDNRNRIKTLGQKYCFTDFCQ
ncbi:9931_t:CDS:1, partial [Gigaspora rosea]